MEDYGKSGPGRRFNKLCRHLSDVPAENPCGSLSQDRWPLISNRRPPECKANTLAIELWMLNTSRSDFHDCLLAFSLFSFTFTSDTRSNVQIVAVTSSLCFVTLCTSARSLPSGSQSIFKNYLCFFLFVKNNNM